MDPAVDILRAVRAVLEGRPRYLQRPPLLDSDLAGIASVASLFDSSAVEEFEAALAKFTKAKHVIATVSGSAALTLGLVAAGVRAGDEVLVPSLTFAASANAIVHAGAVPHFVDVNHETLGIHPFKLRQYIAHGIDNDLFALTDEGHLFNLKTDARISAVMPVHLLGVPCLVDEMVLTAAYYGMKVIEDACEALGSRTFLGDHCGTTGNAGALSFNWNKIVTTCGGGAVLTDDDALAERVRSLAENCKIAHPYIWSHSGVGWYYTMSSLNAAVGIGQMTRLDRTLEKKAILNQRYGYFFNEIQSAKLIGGGNFWLNACLLDPRYVKRNDQTGARDRVLCELTGNGYEARAMFTPMHMLPHFKENPRQPSLETSEDIFRRCVCLPSTVQ